MPEEGKPAVLRERIAVLERELALHRDALEHMHQGLCLFGPNGTIELCNSRYAQILRLPADSVRPGMTGLDVIRLGIAAGDYPADRPPEQIQAEIQARFHSGSASPLPMVRDGHTYAVRRWSTESGNIVSTCEDITARVEAEEALRASEARLSAMLGAMPDCVKIFDRNAQITYINPKGLELLEATDLDTFTASGHAPLSADDVPKAIEVHGRVMAGESVVWEYEIIGMKGRRSRVEAHAVPFRMPGGEPAHMCITRDITLRKTAEEALRRSEERLRLVQETTGLADFETTPEAITQLSDAFLQQAGLPLGTRSITFSEWLEVVHPADREGLLAAIRAGLKTNDVMECEFRIVRADTGEVRWIYSRTLIERDAAGRTIRSIGAHLDITERKRAESALRESEERFRLAAEAAGFGVWDYDAQCDERQWSDRLREVFGLPAGTPATLEAASTCIHPDDRAEFSGRLAALRNGPAFDRFETALRIRRPNDGEERWVALNGWKTVRAISDSVRMIMTVRDITAEKTAEERVRWSANHDQLTGLANRSLFNERLEQAATAARGADGRFGLLLLDMDEFKQINDTLGHDAGDELLKRFADRLRSVVRKDDTVARFGGDEFAVVLPRLESAAALEGLSHAILERLREPFVHAGRVLDCRVSMGASVFPEHGATPEELLKNADIALYVAKSRGRAMLQFFEPQMRHELTRRSTMVAKARAALAEDRIRPFYQPKVNLVTGALDGFEALLRCRAPGGRIEQPQALEAAFEDLDVAAAISDRMIERAIGDMQRWLERGIEFGHVAVNASAAEFRRDNFAERVLDSLAQAGIATCYFQLEVTETVFLGRGAEYVHRALAMLNAAGVRIALDDFGTGYASLRHLKQFPVDLIKIDRSFVRDMHADAGDAAIVRAVINLGKSLGISVVAEGIETRAQADRLVELSCDIGQGFLYSRAVAARQVAGLVERFSGHRSSAAMRAARSGLRLVASSR